jgi:Ca-activated chloride channel family protein
MIRRLIVLLFAAFLSGAALAQVPPASQSSQTTLSTPIASYKVTTDTNFLGNSNGRTVVRIRLSSAELAQALQKKGVKQYSLKLTGKIRAAAGPVQDEFQYPLAGDVREGESLTFSFLRPLPPGSYTVHLEVSAESRRVGSADFPIDVPEVGEAFRPEMAPNDAGTLPSAEAVLLAAAQPAAPPPAGSEPKVRILPPDRETPLGLMRLSAEVLPPVSKVAFLLDDKPIVTRTQPPFTVEVDLGMIPRRQTVKAVGYDAAGNVVDEDAWAVNEGSARVAVRILPIPAAKAAAGVVVKLAVQSINGGVPSRVDLFADRERVATFSAPPFSTTIPAAVYAKASFLRATAVTAEGEESNDIFFLRGQGAAAETVRVDVVQLHVSALDSQGKFVDGLTQKDFSVLEDGRPEKIESFEVARNLPITIGLVIDGSGSMAKAMEFVHTAGRKLFTDLIGEKDKGFVIEFREVPKLLTPPTNSIGRLIDAVEETSARGQTALYDSVVLGLYQFRALTGRKALIVVSDGGDNHSWVDYDTMLRYARTIAIPVYVIGVNLSFLNVEIKGKLKEIANDTGGELFTTTSASKLPEIVTKIEAELRSQYIASYRTDSTKPDGVFRLVKISVSRPDVKLRTIRGYVP